MLTGRSQVKIIAEIGLTHEGSLEKAKICVDECCGMNTDGCSIPTDEELDKLKKEADDFVALAKKLNKEGMKARAYSYRDSVK